MTCSSLLLVRFLWSSKGERLLCLGSLEGAKAFPKIRFDASGEKAPQKAPTDNPLLLAMSAAMTAFPERASRCHTGKGTAFVVGGKYMGQTLSPRYEQV